MFAGVVLFKCVEINGFRLGESGYEPDVTRPLRGVKARRNPGRQRAIFVR